MKKTVTLAELLTASGFTAGQHNDPETTEFYTRSFEKEVETCWHGKLTSSLTVNITIAPKGGWCMASFNKGFRTPYKTKTYDADTAKRTYNAIAATIRNAGFEI